MARFWNGKGIKDVVEQIAEKNYMGSLLGKFSDDEVEQLAKRDPGIKNGDQVISPSGVEHLRISRIEKPNRLSRKSTPEQIGDMLNSLSTSTRRRVVTGKDENPAAVLVPHGDKSYFGLYRADNAGHPEVWTAYTPKTEKLPARMGSLSRTGGAEVSPFNRADQKADLFTQRDRLSAVSPRTESIAKTNDTVNKKAIPWMIGTGAGTGAALYPATADASGTPQYPEEPGLESPFFDPVDIILAPIGSATTAGKALSVMAEPFIDYGMDKLSGLVGRLWGE